MHKNFKSLALAAASLPLAIAAQAGTYDYNFGTLTQNADVFTTVNFNANVANPVRGWYFDGDYHKVSGDALSWSADNTTTIQGTTGAATAELSSGGDVNGNDFHFGNIGTTWDNSTTVSPNGPEGGEIPGGLDFSGAATFNIRQSYAGTPAQQSTVSNTVLHLLTDAVAPMTTVMTDNSPTWVRPATLTAAGDRTCHYTQSTFTLANAGVYSMIASYVQGTTTHDGYLYLYSGSFDAANPLTHLIGQDDDGTLNGTATSNMLLNLSAGSYTMVYTTYSAGTVGADPINVTGYVAGGPQAVPEPMTMTVLGLGALALIRKRRSA